MFLDHLRLAPGYVTMHSLIFVLLVFYFLGNISRIPLAFYFPHWLVYSAQSSCLVDEWTTFNPEMRVNI